jgi:hypothetical protein
VHEVSSVPLGYSVGSEGVGVTALRFTNIQDFQSGVSVYLLDKEINTMVDLRSQPVYEFVAEAGANDSRFEVIFESIATDVDKVQISQRDAHIQVYTFYKKGSLEIYENLLPENTSGEVSVTVTKVDGEIVYQSDYKSSGKHTINAILEKGIYLVTAASAKTEKYTCKVIVAE